MAQAFDELLARHRLDEDQVCYIGDDLTDLVPVKAGLLGVAAGLMAVFAGGLAGWAVSHYVMETSFVFNPASAIAIVAGGVVLTVAAGLAFAWRPLSTSPSRVLRGRE